MSREYMYHLYTLDMYRVTDMHQNAHDFFEGYKFNVLRFHSTASWLNYDV